MSSSTSDPSMDSVSQWIDASLISHPALLHLMESYNLLPFNGIAFGSSSTPDQDFALKPNQLATNNFELSTEFGDGDPHNELARKPSSIRKDGPVWVALDSRADFASTRRVDSRRDRRSQKGGKRLFILVVPLYPQRSLTSKLKRRRAQNRKAQQAFRQRKDTAIARLERETERLKSINQDLSQRNEARLQEIAELRARLGALRLVPLSPSIDGEDARGDKEVELPLSSWLSPSAEAPVGAGTIACLKGRGRLYIDNEVLSTSSTEDGGSPYARSSTGPVHHGGEGFRM